MRRLHPQRTFKTADGRTTVNLVGTGGGPSTFNITTTVAFVVAAAGVVVIKTGSSACRSKSGFADVAAKLGTLKLAMPWEQLEAIVADVGIVFIPPAHYAPILGTLVDNLTPPIYRNVASYLNKIGPLMAPVRVDHQFIGANSLSCLEMLAGACCLLGDVPATLVSSEDGMDEVSTMAPSRVIQLTSDGNRNDETIDPRELGIRPPAADALEGYDITQAAECCERILGGEGTTAQSEIVALNAGVVLTSLGLCSDLAQGLDAARKILRDGAGLRKLEQLRKRVWKNG